MKNFKMISLKRVKVGQQRLSHTHMNIVPIQLCIYTHTDTPIHSQISPFFLSLWYHLAWKL